MLNEILCDKFREKKVSFHSGLNVVLGDEKATNSIGKSALLMVIDFVFGGTSFLTHNQDVIKELGDHEYHFSFKFKGKLYYFSRSTTSPKVVYECDANYKVRTPMPIETYTGWLKKAYGLSELDGSFREMVGLYSRVWGKDNLDVYHPLHNFKSQNAASCIDNLIKLFNRYAEIRGLVDELEKSTSSKEALSAAVCMSFDLFVDFVPKPLDTSPAASA